MQSRNTTENLNFSGSLKVMTPFKFCLEFFKILLLFFLTVSLDAGREGG